ncbi:MAG TPA: MBG domain-containing protein [Opitutus sp.]|nr:MBG domain-containing protein [Opitutus sp.]
MTAPVYRSPPFGPRRLFLEWFRSQVQPTVGPLVIAAFLALAVAPRGMALPVGAQVTAGNVTIAQSAGAMTLTQGSSAAIVNWQSFNLGAGEQMRIVQSGADAAMLARVTGADPSLLLGTLKADGKLFLINPRGVVIGEGAVIDTGAFVASTLDVTDAEFLAGGPLTFRGDSAAGVVNLGTITANGGNVLLLAHTVKNGGTIAAANGTAALGAATEVLLASPDAPGIAVKLNLPQTAEKKGVENSGVIRAAQAQLEAAGGSIYELAINQTGQIHVTGAERRDGRVLLTAGGGTVGVGGEVSAANADGSGGEILVGGDYRGGNPAVANAARTVVTADAKLDASATSGTGSGGRVVVWADEDTRFLGAVSAAAGAQGGDGGFAEISGRHFLDFQPASAVDLAAAFGAPGTLLLDPDVLTISAAATSGVNTRNSNPFVFSTSTSGSVLNVSQLAAQLNGTNVTLDTSASPGDITFASALTWTSGNRLLVRAGGSININASITGGAAGTLELRPGRGATPTTQGLDPLSPTVTLAGSAVITVGTLAYGANNLAAPAGYSIDAPAGTGAADFQGVINVGVLRIETAAGSAGAIAANPGNAIDTFVVGGGGALDLTYVRDFSGDLGVSLRSASAIAPAVIVTTSGALTLLSGSSIGFVHPTNVVLASTGANFINQAGASVFGPNASYLIYSNTTAATTKGGLTGTNVFNTAFDPDDPFRGLTGVNRFFFTGNAASPTLTYTADNLGRVYGDANPALTFGVAGFQTGVPNDVTGAPALSTAATQASGVGAYTITIGQGSLASANYRFAFVNGSLTVTPAPLVITAGSYSRYYGDPDPTFGATVTGLKNGDTTGALSFSTVGQSAAVGSYPISVGVDAANVNYSYTFNAGTLTVNPAPLTVAVDAARLYGDANPDFASLAVATGAKVFPGSTDPLLGLTFGTAATPASNAGTYPITITGAGNPNYATTFGPSTLTVSKAPLTLTVADANRLYGDANPAFSTASIAGFRNGDTASVLSGPAFSTGAAATSPVGTYAISADAGAANYDITIVPGTLTVAKAPASVVINDASRLYGDPNPSFSATLVGAKNGDTASVLSGLTFSTEATSNSAVGVYPILSSIATAQNYAITGYTAGRLAITPVTLTLVAADASRFYGQANQAFALGSYSGLKNGDALASVIPGTVSFTSPATASSAVGAYTITGSGTSASPNYVLAFVPGTLTVNPAPLIVRANDATSVFGNAVSSFSYSVSGLVNGDPPSVVSGVTFGTVILSTAPPGDYAIDIANGGAAANYAITTMPGTLTIGPRPYVVTVADVSTAGGATDLNSILSFSAPPPILGGPSFTFSLSTTATNASPSGNYPITASLVPTGTSTVADVNRYYAISVRPGTLTFTALPVAPQTIKDPGLNILPPMDLTLNDTTLVLNPEDFNVLSQKPAAEIPYGDLFNLPLTAKDYSMIVLQDESGFAAALKNYVDVLSKQSGFQAMFDGLTQAQKDLLNAAAAGSLSMADLAAKIASGDKDTAAALLPVFALYVKNAVESGGASSQALASLFSRLRANINTQRKAVADEATRELNAWQEAQAKINIGIAAVTNLKLMPNVAGAAHDKVMQDAIIGGVGGGVGATLGVAAAGALLMPTVQTVIFQTALEIGGVVSKTGAEIAGAASGAAAPIAIAVGVCVIVTVVALEQIDESERNKAAYDDVVARAQTPLQSVTDLNLDDPKDQLDLYNAFLQSYSLAFGG